ncbi:hypothetical protein E8E14_005642 [Neopestalotiopsis sp. 37M]|nr:hypothetical protein E8E14_005642 [Neopestalotiopsis sp. 37M]
MGEPAREFHCFSKLPQELQLMIWEVARLDKGPVRHCFMLNGSLCPEYAALNWRTRSWMSREEAILEKNHPDPLDESARFINTVVNFHEPTEVPSWAFPTLETAWSYFPSLYSGQYRCDGITNISDYLISYHSGIDRRSPRPISGAWFNFKNDVFYIDSKSSDYGVLPSLRFLSPEINDLSPQTSGPNHLAARIQRLAFKIIITGFQPWEEIDIAILANMSSLKEIFLVYQCRGCCHHFGHEADEYGFIHVSEHPPCFDENIVPAWEHIWACTRRRAEEQKVKMEMRLVQAGRSAVKVKVVADTCFDCNTH